MMRYLVLISISIIILSCSQGGRADKAFFKDVPAFEKEIYDEPQLIPEKIYSLSNYVKSNRAKHLISLYSAISVNEITQNITSSMNLYDAMLFFKQDGDHYNYCRAGTYYGISLLNKFENDTISHSVLREMESIFYKNGYSDKRLEQTLNRYLGKLYFKKREFERAEKYVKKALTISQQSNFENASLYTSIDLFWIYIKSRKSAEALKTLIVFEGRDSLNKLQKFRLYTALAAYYSSKQEYGITLEYLRKVLAINSYYEQNDELPAFYYTLSTYYNREGLRDSAIIYAKRAVDAKTSYKTKENADVYCRFLAHLYKQNGDFENSAKYYDRAFLEYAKAEAELNKAKTMEAERRFDISRYTQEIEELRLHRFLLSSISILVIVLGVIYTYRRGSKNRVYEFEAKRLYSDSKERELMTKRLLVENMLLHASNDYIMKFVEDVRKAAAKSRRVSDEIFNMLNEAIDLFKSKSKSDFSTVSQSEAFINEMDKISFNTTLSDMERIVYVMDSLNFSTGDIAKMLGTTAQSIRVMKMRIREKAGVNNHETNT